jgi:integrase/recombinase XerD
LSVSGLACAKFRFVLSPLLGITCGVRVTELAQIEVQDVLFVSGAIRPEVSLRAVITKGCRQRCIYLAHAQTLVALERYLAYRIKRGFGTELTAQRYRGLSSATALILTHKGSRFYLNTKRRTNFGGERVDYQACDSLQAHITKIYADAGIKGGSSHSGRRSFASNLLHKGASLERVQQLLGHAELDHIMPYLEIDPKKLREMFSVVL